MDLLYYNSFQFHEGNKILAAVGSELQVRKMAIL